MQIVIVGAGAIGGTIGAYLVQAGQQVQFCDAAADHVAAMNSQGLTIEHWEGTYTVPVQAVTPDDLRGSLDCVLLAVKAQHTADALRFIAPLLAPNGYIVSLQNGLNEERIAAAVGRERTIGCLVNFSADYLSPGHIHYGGPGVLKLGELDGQITPRLEDVRERLSAWGNAETTSNIWGYLWGKLGYGNMLYATALADASMADVIDRYRPLMTELAAEVYEVADRLGITPEPFDGVEPSLYYPRTTQHWAAINRSLDALVARRRRDHKQRSGIWRDIMVRRRRTEVNEQLVPVIAHGEALGLQLPLTRGVVACIHALEDGQTEPSWTHLDRLEQQR